MKIVIHPAYGIGYMDEDEELANELGIDKKGLNRENPILIQYLEKYNRKQRKRNAKKSGELTEYGDFPSNELVVIEIPDNCYYQIFQYDGYESCYISETKIIDALTIPNNMEIILKFHGKL